MHLPWPGSEPQGAEGRAAPPGAPPREIPGQEGPHGSWSPGDVPQRQGRGASKLTGLAGTTLLTDRRSDSWMPLGLSKGWAPLRSLCLSLSITAASGAPPSGLQAEGQEAERGGEGRGGGATSQTTVDS